MRRFVLTITEVVGATATRRNTYKITLANF